MRRDIADRTDLVLLISDFYARVFADDLLGHIFVDVAKMDLAAHLPIMGDFWETVLFRTGGYRRNALALHVDLHRVAPLGPEHFARWLELWRATIDDRYAGPNAERAKIQAERIARSMQRRLAGATGSEHVTVRRRDPAQR
ncbi:group III truncated hemoglobin [Micromonospora sp. MS34]|uniref:group III truncated hemoglobin n=1 Tax=Micromonospora sp. MS34 TaxID=3385971 RepID=UPI00399FAB3D